jgi:hypothetical protein
MTQPTLLELAKQGNPKAISALLNQQLKDRGIRSRVAIKEGCLHVLLHAEKHVPDRDAMVDLVRDNLINLDADTIFRAIVYGKQTGEEKPDWSQVLISTGKDFEWVSSSNTDQELEPEDLQSGEMSPTPWVSSQFNPWRVGIIGVVFALGLGIAYFLWYSQQNRQNSGSPDQGRIGLGVEIAEAPLDRILPKELRLSI